MNKSKSKKLVGSDDLSFEDDDEENGFINTVAGHSLSTFSFSEGEVPSPVNTTTNDLPDSRKGRSCPNGITPPVDGEAFDMKRTYAFRKSTIRKLNELKAWHPDVNAYLSTILDEAINYYYEHVGKGNGE
ncbi:MAG: hypothetical protein ABRQ25_13110 [Clostridiaceae bacterium]